MYEDFDEAAYSHLIGDSALTEGLGKWQGLPAIFNGYAPADISQPKNWEGEHFPRIIFFTDWESVPDRLMSGTLQIYITSLDDSDFQPEHFAPLVKERLSEVFFCTKRGVFCCAWNRSESFDYEGTEPIVHGMKLEFDLLSFPDQRIYTEPDPVPAINSFLKRACKSLVVIGMDELEGTFAADPPAAYVRSLGLKNMGIDTYCIRWMEYQAAIHILCTDHTKLRKALGKIHQLAMIEGEIELEGGQQMLITDAGQNLSATYGNSPLLDGQMLLTGRFGIWALEDVPECTDFKIEGDIKSYGRRKEGE